MTQPGPEIVALDALRVQAMQYALQPVSPCPWPPALGYSQLQHRAHSEEKLHSATVVAA